MLKYEPCRLGRRDAASKILEIPVDYAVGYGVGLAAYIPARWAQNAVRAPEVLAPVSIAALASIVSFATGNWGYALGAGSAAFGFFLLEKIGPAILPRQA